MQILVDTKKVRCFEARARAVEVALAREDAEVASSPSTNRASEALTSLKYEYRAVNAAATTTKNNLTTSATTLKTKVRCLARFIPDERPAHEAADQHNNQSPAGMPNATAQKSRERSRSTSIQHLLTSFVRRKQECASVSTEPISRMVSLVGVS